MRHPHLLRSATLCLAAATLSAASFSSTDAQLLFGPEFLDNNDEDEPLRTTLTLEHFSAWEYGTNYFFTDMIWRDNSHDVGTYCEWNPRLSLTRMTGGEPNSEGAFSEFFLTGQVNAGTGFRAFMAGAGVNFNIPGFQVAALDLYVRDDNFNDPTWQLTWVWDVPFQVGSMAAKFKGFLDANGIDDGWNLLTQPQLLFDVGSAAGSPEKRVWLGTELGVQYVDYDGETSLDYVPQIMLRWDF